MSATSAEAITVTLTEGRTDARQCAVRVRRAAAQLARRLRPGLARAGLSGVKLSVLGQLYRLGPVTPTAIAAGESVKLQSLTRVLAELEAEGYLERSQHPLDARQSLVALTGEGSRRLRSAFAAGDARVARIIEDRFSIEERALLSRACALLEVIGEELADDGASAAPSEGGVTPTGAAPRGRTSKSKRTKRRDTAQ